MYKSNNEIYPTFTKVFRLVLDKHPPRKVKKVRGNQGPFMTKELSKAIMNKSKIRNKYQKWPSRENVLALKEAKKFFNKLPKSVKKAYFRKATGKCFVNNKAFWNRIKPFLTNKGFLTNETIAIENKGKIVTDKSKLVNLFNAHYINIVEKTSGCPPEIEGNPENKTNDKATVQSIIRKYQTHPSILNIKSKNTVKNTFNIPSATSGQINKIIKELNVKKATGPDKVPLKIVRLSANIIDSHLTDIINSDLLNDSFSEDAKTASVRPISKKKKRDKIENYRPISILKCFSKIYEKLLLEAFKPFINTFLSEYIAAYREHYSSNHVLIRLIENWKKALDGKFFVRAVLMDFSKAFDCVPHDLLISKLHAYGFSEKTVTFIYSYLKRRKQNVKIENFYNFYLPNFVIWSTTRFHFGSNSFQFIP